MNFGIIVQARMGSSRLPGKILKPFWRGKELLAVLLDKLHEIEGVKVIVATSVNSENNELVTYLKERGEIVYRGSEDDVLERFIMASEENGVDSVVRICSDNPFLDVDGVRSLIDKAKNADADYIGYDVCGKPSILTHFGFWGEFVRLSALKRVFEETPVHSPAHEHVTIDLYTHQEEYKCEWIKCPSFICGREDIRLTIDTIEDFGIAQKVYSDLKSEYGRFSLKNVVEYLDQHVELRDKMAQIIQGTKKAGYDYKR